MISLGDGNALFPSACFGDNQADMAEFLYEFDWDPAKAKANLAKHGIDFEHAVNRPGFAGGSNR